MSMEVSTEMVTHVHGFIGSFVHMYNVVCVHTCIAVKYHTARFWGQCLLGQVS